MAFDQAAFVQKLYDIEVKKKAIAALQAQRKIDEQALVDQYKVDECNAARNAVAVTCANAVQTLVNEIKAIEDTLT